MEEILKKFSSSQNYIYKINNTYYYIGACLFRECNNEEIELFINMNHEYDRLKKSNYPKEPNDLRLFDQYLEDIINMEEAPYTHALRQEITNKVKQILICLSKKELESIKEQIDKRKEILEHHNRFYRF